MLRNGTRHMILKPLEINASKENEKQSKQEVQRDDKEKNKRKPWST